MAFNGVNYSVTTELSPEDYAALQEFARNNNIEKTAKGYNKSMALGWKLAIGDLWEEIARQETEARAKLQHLEEYKQILRTTPIISAPNGPFSESIEEVISKIRKG